MILNMCPFLFVLHASKWDYKALGRYIKIPLKQSILKDRMNTYQYKKDTPMRREKLRERNQPRKTVLWFSRICKAGFSQHTSGPPDRRTALHPSPHWNPSACGRRRRTASPSFCEEQELCPHPSKPEHHLQNDKKRPVIRVFVGIMCTDKDKKGVSEICFAFC